MLKEIVGVLCRNRLTAFRNNGYGHPGVEGDRFGGVNIVKHPKPLHFDSVVNTGQVWSDNDEIRDKAILEARKAGVPYIEVNLDLANKVAKLGNGK